MTNMENLDYQLVEKERQQRIYESAMATLKKRSVDRETRGVKFLLAVDAMRDTKRPSSIAKAAKGAELFCIGFAFFAPCLLFWTYVL